MFKNIILSPFILFLLLLIVLLISIIYGSNKSRNMISIEGLTDYNPEVLSLGVITLESYSNKNPLFKLYGAKNIFGESVDAQFLPRPRATS